MIKAEVLELVTGDTYNNAIISLLQGNNTGFALVMGEDGNTRDIINVDQIKIMHNAEPVEENKKQYSY